LGLKTGFFGCDFFEVPYFLSFRLLPPTSILQSLNPRPLDPSHRISPSFMETFSRLFGTYTANKNTGTHNWVARVLFAFAGEGFVQPSTMSSGISALV